MNPYYFFFFFSFALFGSSFEDLGGTSYWPCIFLLVAERLMREDGQKETSPSAFAIGG